MAQLSDARKRANANWDEKHREERNHMKARSAARSFIRNKATVDDLNELQELLKERRKELDK